MTEGFTVKKYFLAASAALALSFGGLVASAPAQAEEAAPMVHGSSTYFNSIDLDIPRTIDLYNTSITGYEYRQSFGTIRNNVAKTCPKNEHYRLYWFHPDGRKAILAPGQCFWPGQSVQYSIALLRAD